MDLKSLPEELLPHIFSYLLLGDRKNVRLTCHLWNEACNRPAILKHEKFVIHFDGKKDDIACIAACMKKCKSLRTNIEFQGFPLKQFPASVWEHCCDEIESLFIYECEVNDETIRNIILNCLNLRSFHLRSSFEARGGFCSEAILDDLVKWKIKRNKLISFQLYMYVHPGDAVFRTLFQIYPNIRSFGCGHCDSIRNFSKELEFPPLTESFIYDSDADSSWMVPLCKNPQLKFTELKIRISFSSEFSKMNIVKDFFSKQNELTKLKLSCTCEGDGAEMKSLLFHILQNCPNLKEFQLHTNCSIDLSVTESVIFLSEINHLESLSLSVGYSEENRLDRSSSNESITLISYPKMTKLRLSFYNRQIFTTLLNRCPYLQCLHLEHVSINDKTLQNILEKQPALKKLRLHFKIGTNRNPRSLSSTLFESLPSDDSNPSFLQAMKRSFNCLQNLQHLEIHGLTHHLEVNGCMYDTFDELFSEMYFPNLKYFYFEPFLCNNKQSVYKLVNIVTSRAPCLEVLKLDSPLYLAWSKSDLLNESHMIDYCQRLKKLKCLIINPFFPEEHYGFHEHPVKQLFIKCPSLTFVSGYGRRYGMNLASYCQFSETLKWYRNFTFEKMKCFHWLFKEKISNLRHSECHQIIQKIHQKEKTLGLKSFFPQKSNESSVID